MDDLIRDFLIESKENLDRLDQELVKLESDPSSKELLSSIFRTIHTIKGSCGFLGFAKLEKVAHTGESLLSLLRDGKLLLTTEIASGLLEMVDAVRCMLAEIETTEQDGKNDYPDLVSRLVGLQRGDSSESAANGRAKKAVGKEPPPPAKAPLEEKELPLAETMAPPSLKAPQASETPQPVKEDVADTQRVAQAPEEARQQHDASAETLRVGVKLLDNLMTQVGELVLARNQLLQFSASIEDSRFQAVSQRMNSIATELQEQVMKTRMQPIGNIWSKFPRTVRDVATACHKEVRIEMEGEATELDKTIIEAIKDPLTHLVRNSVDHGIESPEARLKAGKKRVGRLLLRAFHEGGQVNIEITDDGAGLNRERIRSKAIERNLITAEQSARMSDRELFNLICLPGFSTAEKITNVSGRGVGMDVVKTNVERIGGTIDIHSEAGKGTTVRVKIPLTLAIIPALIVRSRGERFAVPQINLTELVRVEAEKSRQAIELVHGAPVYRLRGRLLPLIYLNSELSLAAEEKEAKDVDHAVNIAVLESDGHRFGLVVDEIRDSEEIVVKPLRKSLKSIGVYAGASIMGDGKIALILDVPSLGHRAGVLSRAARAEEEMQAKAAVDSKEKFEFLIFAGPDDSRLALTLGNLARLEEMPRSQIENLGSESVVQYRNKILPLIHLASVLEERRREWRHPEAHGSEAPDSPLQVLVCHDGDGLVGLVVDRILDVIETAVDIKYPPTRTGVSYSTVIGGRVTELIDIPAVLRATRSQQTAEHDEVLH